MVQTGGQHIVAHQDGHLIIISGIDRGLSATLVALVHHIIVNETGRMEQLQGYGGMKSRLVYRTASLGGEQGKQGTHHLATPLLHVGKHLIEQRIGTAKRVGKQALELFKFLRNRSLYFVQIIHWN